MGLLLRIRSRLTFTAILALQASVACSSSSTTSSTQNPNQSSTGGGGSGNEPSAPTVTPNTGLLSSDFSTGSHIADTNNGGWYVDEASGASVNMNLNVTDPNVYHCLQASYTTGTSGVQYAGVKVTYDNGFQAEDGALTFLLKANASTNLQVSIDTPLNSNTTTDAWSFVAPATTTWTQIYVPLDSASFTWSGTGTPHYTLDQALATTVGFRFRVLGASAQGVISMTRVRIYNDVHAATADAAFWDNMASNTTNADSGNAAWYFESGSANNDAAVSQVLNAPGHAGPAITVTYTAGTGVYTYGQARLQFASDQNMLEAAVSFWVMSPSITSLQVGIDTPLSAANSYNTWVATVPIQGNWTEVTLPINETNFQFQANNTDPSQAYSLEQAIATFHSVKFETTSVNNASYSLEQVRVYDYSNMVRPNSILSGDFNTTSSSLSSGNGTWAASSSSGGSIQAASGALGGYPGNGLYATFTNSASAAAYSQIAIEATTSPISPTPQKIVFWARAVASDTNLQVLIDTPNAASSNGAYFTATVPLTRDWQEVELPVNQSIFVAPTGNAPNYTLTQAIGTSTGFLLRLGGGSNSGFLAIDTLRVF